MTYTVSSGTLNLTQPTMANFYFSLDYYYYYYYYFYYYYFLLLLLLSLAQQHKAAGMEIKLSKNNDNDGVSSGVECSQEGDRIPPLKSKRQALEQEHPLS